MTDVSVVGPTAGLSNDGAPSDVLRRATAQGLTRWDSAGVVTPALASRWIVLDEGLTIILRLDQTRWSDGTPVRASTVVERLSAILAQPGDRPTIRALARAVDEVNAITPSIVELRLTAQRPDLLALLAQPEFAMIRSNAGAGPLRPLRRDAGWRPLASPEQPDDAVIRLRGDSAARALARYEAGTARLVLGGTVADTPLLKASEAGPPLSDPTDGLFALAIRHRTGLLATPDGREALSLAIDRPALLRAFGVSDWPALAAGSESTLPFDESLALARQRVTRARGPVRLTLARPAGPGGRLLLAVLTRQLARAGITLSTAPASSADLVLIDAVAPSTEPASSLELIGCGRPTPCGPALIYALDRLADQPTPAGWRFWSARAVEAARADWPVIPLARPLRWSVARPGLALTPNARAIHPLTSLIAPASAVAP